MRGNAKVSGQISRRVEELERRYYEDIAAQMLTVAKPTYSADYSAPLPRKQFKWTLGNTVLYAFNLLSTIGLFAYFFFLQLALRKYECKFHLKFLKNIICRKIFENSHLFLYLNKKNEL